MCSHACLSSYCIQSMAWVWIFEILYVIYCGIVRPRIKSMWRLNNTWSVFLVRESEILSLVGICWNWSKSYLTHDCTAKCFIFICRDCLVGHPTFDRTIATWSSSYIIVASSYVMTKLSSIDLMYRYAATSSASVKPRATTSWKRVL